MVVGASNDDGDKGREGESRRVLRVANRARLASQGSRGDMVEGGKVVEGPEGRLRRRTSSRSLASAPPNATDAPHDT